MAGEKSAADDAHTGLWIVSSSEFDKYDDVIKIGNCYNFSTECSQIAIDPSFLLFWGAWYQIPLSRIVNLTNINS